MYTALSNGKRSAALSFLRTFVLLAGAILLLPRLFGIVGVWLAVPAAEGIMFLVSGVCLFRSRERECVDAAAIDSEGNVCHACSRQDKESGN